MALAAVACARPRASSPFTFPLDDGGPALMALAPRVVVDTSGGRLQGNVPFRYRNRGPGVAAVYESCGPDRPNLERWDGTRWVRNVGIIRFACIGQAMRVPVGAVWRDSISLDAVVPEGTRTRSGLPVGGFYTRPIEGRYRLAWGVYAPAPASSDAIIMGPPGPLRAESERTSNEFEIVARPVPADYLEARVTRSRGELSDWIEEVRVWREAGVLRAEQRLARPRRGTVRRTVRRVQRSETELGTLLLRIDSLFRQLPPTLARPGVGPGSAQCGEKEWRYQLDVRDGTSTRLVRLGCGQVATIQEHRQTLARIYDELAIR